MTSRSFQNVAVLDVPPVLPQVRRNPVRPGLLAHQRRGHRVGFAPAPPTVTRLPQRRDMIDIDTQLQHTVKL